jgi:hypothetical protein
MTTRTGAALKAAALHLGLKTFAEANSCVRGKQRSYGNEPERRWRYGDKSNTNHNTSTNNRDGNGNRNVKSRSLTPSAKGANGFGMTT